MKKEMIILYSLIAFFSSCSFGKKKEISGEHNQVKTPFSETIKTEKTVLAFPKKSLLLTGKVEYDPDKIISYVPLISGIIEKTYFLSGDKVQKGQPLLDVRSTELSALQSEKRALEADEKVAERELRTAQSLFDDNVLSEKEFLEAQGKMKQIQASINKIKADMRIYGEDKDSGIFTVKAPMNGFIVQKNASTGRPISADQNPVFTIADLSTVWIMANVYAGDLLFVREGMDVEISALSYPNEVFQGKINALSQVFDSEEKVLKARIIMDNTDLKFKPEMSVMVNLKDEQRHRLVSIPSDALIFDDNRFFVVVEVEADKFNIREVTLQGHHDKTTYLTSGLVEGESVVVRNQLFIYSELK